MTFIKRLLMSFSFFIVTLFLGVFSASAEEVMFSATVTVRVTNGYYNATISYIYDTSNTKGNHYLRYDYTNPTKMVDLIDYNEGKRYKVCTKCESGFYAYPAPALFKQSTDVATGVSEGSCVKYIPKDTSGILSIWYNSNGVVCKAELPDGKTLILTNVNTKFSNKDVFNLEGNECPAPVCKRVMDLVFVIDKSGSICGGNSGKKLTGYSYCDLGNWIKIQDFVVEIVESFDIGTDATMVGIVTFSNGATQVSPLSSNRQAIISAMRGAELTPWITCTGCGIDMGMDILKNTTSARSALNPEKVMIVMTDGLNNRYFGAPCAYYSSTCTTENKNNCLRWECPDGYETTTSSVCTKYETTSTCKKYKCGTCTSGKGDCINYTCTKWNTSNCIRYSTTKCSTAYPSNSYCGIDSNGAVVNKNTGYVYCMCGTYKCEEYECLTSTCSAYECSNCAADDKSYCVEYEKKCVEMASRGTCKGQEKCAEYECTAGSIKCEKYLYNYYAMITGAINRTRTEWALYPASKRLPIVMVIGVTSYVSLNELRAIASTLEGKPLVYTVMTFNDLSTIINDLVDETCVSQTEDLELCDSKCNGFCGCEKKCYCPTCDVADGSCYSISCNVDSDSKTSTGCVATHKSCTTDNKCLLISANNGTSGCCVTTTKDCVKDADKCKIYSCNSTTGCTVKDRDCTPTNACFNVTCDPVKGCVETPACDDSDPCKVMSCSVAADGQRNCSYTDKCSSNDLCQLPVCTNGVCSLTPKVCTPKNDCFKSTCFRGECINETNVDKKIECASSVVDSCSEGYCDEEDGTCKTKKNSRRWRELRELR